MCNFTNVSSDIGSRNEFQSYSSYNERSNICFWTVIEILSTTLPINIPTRRYYAIGVAFQLDELFSSRRSYHWKYRNRRDGFLRRNEKQAVINRNNMRFIRAFYQNSKNSSEAKRENVLRKSRIRWSWKIKACTSLSAHFRQHSKIENRPYSVFTVGPLNARLCDGWRVVIAGILSVLLLTKFIYGLSLVSLQGVSEWFGCDARLDVATNILIEWDYCSRT